MASALHLSPWDGRLVIQHSELLMTRDDFLKAVATFLASQERPLPELDANTELLASGLVDSLTLIQLLMHLEATFQRVLDYSRIKPSHLRTVDSLYSFLCESEGMAETRTLPR